MSKAVSITLGATAVSFTNEWVHSNSPNFRILMAGMGASLFLGGLSNLNETLGTGVAVIFLITVLVTPIDKKSPVETLNDLINGAAITPSTKNSSANSIYAADPNKPKGKP